MEAGADETQEGWNGIDPVATACQMDTQVTEPTTEAITTRQQHGLPDMQTPTQPQRFQLDQKSLKWPASSWGSVGDFRSRLALGLVLKGFWA